MSPCGNYLISVSIDHRARVWDIRHGTILSQMDMGEWYVLNLSNYLSIYISPCSTNSIPSLIWLYDLIRYSS